MLLDFEGSQNKINKSPIVSQSKLDRQELVALRFRNIAKGRGICVMPTGFGKSFIALNILTKYHNKNPKGTIIIAVPGEGTRATWKKYLRNHILEDIILIKTRAELLNLNFINIDFLVVDEIHKFYPEESSSLIDGRKINYKYILGLTATPKDNKQRHLKILNIAPIFDTISEKEAIENKWISKYIEYNLGIEMSEETSDMYYEYTVALKKFMGLLPAGLDSARLCLYGGKDKHGRHFDKMNWVFAIAKKYGWHSKLDLNNPIEKEIADKYNPNAIIGYAKNLMAVVRERKELLYNAPEKIVPVIELVNKFNTLKTICFSQSTAFADRIADSINLDYKKRTNTETEICTIYHTNIASRPLINPTTKEYYVYQSGRKKGTPKIFGQKTLKEAAINAIQTGMCRIISTASALDEGFSVNDIRLGITTSGTSNFNQHKQRTGRAKRVDELFPDHTAIIVNIYLKGTKDEDWLNSRQSESTSDIFWVDSVNEIEFEPGEREIDKLDLNSIL